MIMGASVKATPDKTIHELKNDYYAHFGHFPRGRFANQCAWLTSNIALSIRLKSTPQPVAQVLAPTPPVIPKITLAPANVVLDSGAKF
jgi:hypothetical protein